MKVPFDQVPVDGLFIEPEDDRLCIKVWDDRARIDGTDKVIPVNPMDIVEINPLEVLSSMLN